MLAELVVKLNCDPMIFMKIILRIFVWLVALGLIVAVVGGSWWLKEQGSAADGEEAAPAVEKAVVDKTMSRETRELLGVRVEPLAKAVWWNQVPALGRVVDPGPLVALWNERAIVEAAIKMSHAEAERDRMLLTKNAGVAQAALDQAEAQEATDHLKMESVNQRLRFEWGPSWVEPRLALQSALVDGSTVLVRAEIMTPVPMPAAPALAWVRVPGQEMEPVSAVEILPAANVDPKVQGSAWILVMPGGVPLPPPGAMVGVALGKDGAGTEGVLIPSAAVMQFEGQSWVFLEGEERPGRFERKSVRTDRPLKGGYFMESGFKAGDPVVTTAAAMLLAQQTSGQTGNED